MPNGVLDACGSVLYSDASVRNFTLKDSQERAVKLYSSYFAFTYRFLFGRKRAGETRAGESVD